MMTFTCTPSIYTCVFRNTLIFHGWPKFHVFLSMCSGNPIACQPRRSSDYKYHVVFIIILDRVLNLWIHRPAWFIYWNFNVISLLCGGESFQDHGGWSLKLGGGMGAPPTTIIFAPPAPMLSPKPLHCVPPLMPYPSPPPMACQPQPPPSYYPIPPTPFYSPPPPYIPPPALYWDEDTSLLLAPTTGQLRLIAIKTLIQSRYYYVVYHVLYLDK